MTAKKKPHLLSFPQKRYSTIFATNKGFSFSMAMTAVSRANAVAHFRDFILTSCKVALRCVALRCHLRIDRPLVFGATIGFLLGVLMLGF